MNFHLLLGQVPGTLLFFAVVLTAAAAMLNLGMRVERDQVAREVRAGRLVIVPEESELEQLLAPYTRSALIVEDDWTFR